MAAAGGLATGDRLALAEAPTHDNELRPTAPAVGSPHVTPLSPDHPWISDHRGPRATVDPGVPVDLGLPVDLSRPLAGRLPGQQFHRHSCLRSS
jgi:hypothetical protein